MNPFIYFIFINIIKIAINTRAASAFPTEDVCVTQECYETGQKIRDSLNKSIDPCANVYGYACDGWLRNTALPESEYAWDKWQSIDLNVQKRIDFILNYTSTTTTANDREMNELKRFHSNCVSSTITKDDIVRLISTSNYGKCYWSLFHQNEDEQSSTDDCNWISSILAAVKTLDVHPLLRLAVRIDLFNASRNALYIESGDLVLPPHILKHPVRFTREIDVVYKRWIRNVSDYLLANTTRNSIDPIDRRDEETAKLIEFELKLNELNELVSSNKYERVSIEEFHQMTGIDLSQTLRTIYDHPRLDYIILSNRDYLKQLVNLLRVTDRRTIGNFIGWSIIKEISKYGDARLREHFDNAERHILHVQKPISLRRRCVQFVAKYNWHVIISKYAQLYVESNAEESVRMMLDRIKNEFVARLKKNHWIEDQRLRSYIIRRIKDIKYLIGYPKGRQHFKVTERERQLNALEYLSTMVNHYVISEFNKINAEPEAMWPENVFEVNAYYNTIQNLIVVPITIMQMPFYSAKRPAVFNYAALGFLLAHEMSHALDGLGHRLTIDRRQHKNRLMASKRDKEEFAKKLRCFRELYEKGVNGVRTLNENIADNIGLDVSYRALLENDSDKNIMLPYLEQMSEKQLYFVSFAQLWCEIENETNNFFMESEEHSVNRDRVTITLNNNANFAKSFYCSALEVKKQCNLWWI